MYSSLKNTLVSSFCSTLFFLYLQLPSLINNDNKNAEVFSSLKISAKNAAENKKSKRLYNSILQFIDIYLSLSLTAQYVHSCVGERARLKMTLALDIESERQVKAIFSSFGPILMFQPPIFF